MMAFLIGSKKVTHFWFQFHSRDCEHRLGYEETKTHNINTGLAADISAIWMKSASLRTLYGTTTLICCVCVDPKLLEEIQHQHQEKWVLVEITSS